MVRGQKYRVRWSDPERLDPKLMLSFHLHQTTNCAGRGRREGVRLSGNKGSSTVSATKGWFEFTLPATGTTGGSHFIEIRPLGVQSTRTIPLHFAAVPEADRGSGGFASALDSGGGKGAPPTLALPSNYSSFFSVVNAADAPPSYHLYVENDVDLLSAFHRDCKKNSD